MIYPAHFRKAAGGTWEIQTVTEHSRNAAEISSQRLHRIQFSRVAYLAGLTHDLGKMCTLFREYMEKIMAGQPVQRGSVIHAYAAARFFLERFHTSGSFCSTQDMTAELLAYATGAHHGLFDCVDERHNLGFSRRLQWDKALYQEALEAFTEQCAGSDELDDLFHQACNELEPVYGWINSHDSNEEIFFYLGLLARLLLSSVIEGDRLDTIQYQHRTLPNIFLEPQPAFWSRLLLQVERKLDRLSHGTPIQCARREISKRCRDSADLPSGIYRLHVPTGGGKTLASLRFALAHAAVHKKSRIIFTLPLLSILDQNAAVLREYIADDSLVLEHHSNIILDKSDRSGSDELDPKELMAQNWDAPIIITTLVQLLNTLFDGRTTCIRRFQSLCNCVLVIDEVQTVPPRMLSLFNLAMNFLANVCGATIVLCSATQPCLEAAVHPLQGSPPELIPYDPDLWAPFQRTQIIAAEPRRLDEIPDFIQEALSHTTSLLVVCNTKKQAQFLFRQLQHADTVCFHLSASMCQAHRKTVLNQMCAALEESRKGGPQVLCVSTQVIEAGVDVSFGSVIRLAAGMDNVVQAAGRCNRNGESAAPVPVYLLNCSDENLCRLQEIQNAKTATLQLLSAFCKNPEQFDSDLTSDTSISCYYRNLYCGMPPGAQDYPLRNGTFLFDLLSVNKAHVTGWPGMEQFGLHQAFKEAGHAFQVFDQETYDVLGPYGEGANLIAELGSEAVQRDQEAQEILLKKAKPFTISLYQYQKEILIDQHGLAPYLGGVVLALSPNFYHNETGLTFEGADAEFLEV